jgi:transposase-like protein
VRRCWAARQHDVDANQVFSWRKASRQPRIPIAFAASMIWQHQRFTASTGAVDPTAIQARLRHCVGRSPLVLRWYLRHE